jgi:hypothetical protein
MNTVIISVENGMVAALNRPPLPFEREISLPYPLQLQKTIERVQGEKQKVNEHGQPLYLSPDGEETTEAEGNTPIMVPNTINEFVSFENNPFEFTEEEVIAAKQKSIEQNSFNKVVYFNEMMEVDDFSIELASHSADMGAGFISLHPGGQVRTKKLQLGAAVERVELYAEVDESVKIEVGTSATNFVPVEKGIALLPEASDAVYVRFSNTSDTHRAMIKSFGILA